MSETTVDHGSAPAVPEHPPESLGAIPVRIVETEKRTAELGAFTSYVLAGSEAPFQLLPQTKRRNRSTVIVQPAPGQVATQYVRIGRRSAVGGGQAAGALVPSGTSFTYEAGAEVWAQPQAANGQVLIIVIDEWYRE